MRWPAEWEPHEAVWVGFPGSPVEWPIALSQAQEEVAAFANAVSCGGTGEQVLLVCRNEKDAALAHAMVEASVRILVEPFGDIWLRDSGPIIALDTGSRIANLHRFNGWGKKFEMAGDEDIGLRLTTVQNMSIEHQDWVLEGGAIDGDGSGRLLTTEQCVLNPNRNNVLSEVEFAERMEKELGISDVCWLGDGLVNDHTDGHVDNLARFVAPATVAIPQSDEPDDPNKAVFENAASRAKEAELSVVRLPSVGKYLLDGDIAPASYMNFYVGNHVVAVPQYEASNDSKAREEIGNLFPDREVVGLSSKALLRGGGSFHCISQQIPAAFE